VQPLALTLGEPAGIGPDLALAIWHRRAELDIPHFYIVADPEFLAGAPIGSASTFRSPP
jgi:4-hydroxythreonine-4-phosphate dehydrogenase